MFQRICPRERACQRESVT
jgi:hypothetical protein